MQSQKYIGGRVCRVNPAAKSLQEGQHKKQVIQNKKKQANKKAARKPVRLSGVLGDVQKQLAGIGEIFNH